MSIKKIIGNLDIEIEFRSNEKNFENVKNKIFSFLSKNFFKDPKNRKRNFKRDLLLGF